MPGNDEKLGERQVSDRRGACGGPGLRKPAFARGKHSCFIPLLPPISTMANERLPRRGSIGLCFYEEERKLKKHLFMQRRPITDSCLVHYVAVLCPALGGPTRTHMPLFSSEKSAIESDQQRA